MWVLVSCVILVLVAVVWYSWDRVLAAGVGFLARRSGLHLEVGSLTIKNAIHVLVRCIQGPVDEVQCRRIQLGWQSEVDEDSYHQDHQDGSGNAFQKYMVLLGSFRLNVKLYGVRVKLTACLDDEKSQEKEDVSSDGKGKKKGSRSAFYLSFLSFLSLEVEDLEIRYQDGSVLVRVEQGRVALGRSRQDIALQQCTICPGGRKIVEDKIVVGDSLSRIDQLSLEITGSIHTLMRGGSKKRRDIKVTVNDTAICLCRNRVELARQCMQSFKRGKENKPEQNDLPVDLATRIEKSVEKMLGSGKSSVHIDTEFRCIGVSAPMKDMHTSTEFKSLRLDCHISPRTDDSTAKVEVSANWGKFSFSTGVSDNEIALECQSSEAGATFGLADPFPRSCQSEQQHLYDVDIGVNMQALHTRCNHGNVSRYVSQMRRTGLLADLPGEGRKEEKDRFLSALDNHMLPLSARVSVVLGNGSSLQFVDAHGECTLHQSIDSALLSMKYRDRVPNSNGVPEGARDDLLLAFDVDGIAMAISRRDSVNLCQILATESLRTKVYLEEAAEKREMTVKVGSLNANLPREALAKVSSILEEIDLDSLRKRKRQTGIAANSPAFKINLHLEDWNIALVGGYDVSKEASLMNKSQAVDAALAVRLRSLEINTIGSKVEVLYLMDLKVLHFHGSSLKVSGLDFDSMDASVRSPILILDDLKHVHKQEESRRNIRVGSCKIFGDIDAGICLISSLNCLKLGRMISQKRLPNDDSKSVIKTSTGTSGMDISVKMMHASIPLSSDREISAIVENARFEHSRSLSNIAYALDVQQCQFSIRGVPVIIAEKVSCSQVTTPMGDGSALSVLNGKVQKLSFILPHDRDPGPTARYCMMYYKASRNLFENLSGLGENVKSSLENQCTNSGMTTRINFTVAEGSFVVEHHPLEQKHARTYLARRKTAIEQYLWTEAESSFLHELGSAVSPLHTGINTKTKPSSKPKKEEYAQHGHEIWLRLMKETSKSYIKDVDSIRQEERIDLHANILSVHIKDMSLVAISNRQLHSTSQAKLEAEKFVRELDEHSESVDFVKSYLFDLNMESREVSIDIGGSNRPLFHGKGIQIDGPVAFAKQRTAPAMTYEKTVPVGAHHAVSIQVAHKGTNPPFKVYTDIKGKLLDSIVYFTPGLEPTLSIMGICMKRLVPTDPDGISRKPAAVPWWDDMRYLWRGKALLSTDTLDLCLAPGTEAFYSPSRDRLLVDAKSVTVKMLPGTISIETAALKGTIVRNSPCVAGGRLISAPLLDCKAFSVNLGLKWNMPNDRNPQDHHLFPKHSTVEVQDPVAISDLFVSRSVDLSIEAHFPETSQQVSNIFIGGDIISFWRDFISGWQIPSYVKRQAKKGTYFIRKPKGVKKKGIPKLLRNLSLSVHSKDLDLTHFTTESMDPGGGLACQANKVLLRMKWLCNEEVQSFLMLPPHAKVSHNPDPVTRTSLKHLEVYLTNVWVRSLFSVPGSTRQDSSPVDIDSNNDLLSSLVSEVSIGDTFGGFHPEWRAKHVSIHRSNDSLSCESDLIGSQQERPLKVSVNDCCFVTDAEMRDTIWATVEHLIAAFAKKIDTWPSIMAVNQMARTNPSPSPIDRSYSRQDSAKRAYSQSSELSVTAENNELLSLLLQQKENEGEAPGIGSSNLPSPQVTLEMDSFDANQGPQIGEPPMTSILDDLQSQLKYEVEVTNLQLVLQRDTETGSTLGRLLLAAKTGMLKGMRSEQSSSSINITSLNLEDVQAYASLSSVDPHKTICWLDINEKNEFVAPSLDEVSTSWRRIFNPININLRHSKSHPARVLTRRGSVMPFRPFSPQVTAQNNWYGEELVLRVPDIAAVIDGREFEVIMDVVSFLIMSGPQIEVCNQERRLLMESENEEIEKARCVFLDVHQQLQAIRNDGRSLLESLPGLSQTGTWGIEEPFPFSGASELSLKSAIYSSEDKEIENPSTALRSYLDSMLTRSDRSDTGDQNLHSSSTLSSEERINLILRWNAEQESISYETYQNRKDSLCEKRDLLKRSIQQKNASRILIQLNRVVWQLCDQERSPFVQASIKKVTFDQRKNKDHSGSAKFIIHRIDILDATGFLPEGPATPAGVILTTWNPDDSYEREPVLRIISTLGVPTSKRNIYEHLDATLHPLSLHFTEEIASACWEYFFPKEDSKSRQETFSSTVTARRSKKFSSESMTDSPAKSNPRASRVLDEQPSGQVSPKSAKRISDANSNLDLQSSPGSTRRKDLGSGLRRKSRPHRRLLTLFKYVKLNRAHMRITYQGYPIGIKDRVLVINSYTCENLDGTWRDVLSNVKQKAILSAIGSGLGLQGRKIKELMAGAAPAVALAQPDHESKSSHGFLSKIGLRHKKREDSPRCKLEQRDAIDFEKRRALFGESFVSSARGVFHRQMPEDKAVAAGQISPEEQMSPSKAERMPTLDLDRALPPEDDSSSDSDDNQTPVSPRLQLAPGPSPLGDGLQQTADKTSEDTSQQPWRTGYYSDPYKPPELLQGSARQKNASGGREEGNEGPRWMKSIE